VVFVSLVLFDVDTAQLHEVLACAAACAASLGNVWLWLFLRASYFSDVLRTTALLHMWSLGVEEQFYWVLPVLLRLPLKLLHLLVVPGLVAASSIGAWWAFDRLDQSTSYYLLPFRMAELLVGVWLAIHVHLMKKDAPPSTWLTERSNELALIGVSVLCVTAATWDSTIPFPSWYALVPACATALIIFAGARSNPMSGVLSTPILTWIGTLSYSMYLWHWPAIVLLNRWGVIVQR
jgi:peptidoglycan/LPS O-acetylase OafA/YrhL